MKKFLNVLMLISIFFLAVPVMALEKEELVINSVMQNDKELSVIDGVYQVDSFDRIVVNYTIKNPSTTRTYTFERVMEYGGGSSNSFSGLTNDYMMVDWTNLDINSEISYITYNLYNGGYNDEKELLDSQKIALKFTKFDEYNLNNSKLYITEVKQGGNVITLNEESNCYEFNKIQDIVLKIKGENFSRDKKYPIYISNDLTLYKEYTGKELNDGFELTISVKDQTNYSPNVYIKYDVFFSVISAKPLSCKGIDYCNFNYSFKDNDSVSDYDVKLSYANYKDKRIKKVSEFDEYSSSKLNIVSSKYHSENNPLVVNISGKNYLDKDYTVKINVIRNKNILYTKEVNVNGLLLNDGYSIKLDNFTSSKDKTYDEGKDEYIIETNIDYVTSKTTYMYGYSENYSTISSEIFFENGKKNLSTFRGNGGYYYNSGFADTNKDAFRKYDKVYLRYVGNDFDDDTTYDYEFSYGYSDNVGGIDKTEILKTGTITGRILNSIGLLFAVNNKNNYEYPTYRLEVKYDGEIIYYSSSVLYLIDTPTLANVSLTNENNKDLYLKMDDYSYMATRNFPITLAISGLGFEDDKDYKIAFSEDYTTIDDNYEHTMKEYTFKGKELNDGKALIKLNKEITSDIKEAYLYVMYQLEDGGYGQGGFSITFVDSKDLISNITKYVVDNVSDLIKNISKNTSVSDFANNVTVKDNGKIRVYDTTGTTEITGNVGTGMIARVVDSNDYNLLDLDVVVKGDVSGDGNISITDLVKVKRHLSGDEELTGVYEVAGNITETDSIGITDLVKIARDVAKIQEVE